MNFTSQMRYNPESGEYEKFHGLKPEEIRDISCGLTYKYEHQGERELWDDQMAVYNDVVRQKIDEYWQRLVEEKGGTAMLITLWRVPA